MTVGKKPQNRKRKSRGGRPRKTDLKRAPNGRSSTNGRVERPTQELQARRVSIAGPGAETLSSCGVDILLARQIIDKQQHKAALRFAWLHGKAVGSFGHAGLKYDRTEVGIVNRPYDPEHEARLARLSREYSEMKAELHRETFGIVRALVIHDELPPLPTANARGNPLQVMAIQGGLNTLAKSMGFKRSDDLTGVPG